LQLDHEYLWSTTKHHQSENGTANYRHSHTGKLNSVYFGPQMATNRIGVLTHPMGGHHAGHCHASSFLNYSRLGQNPLSTHQCNSERLITAAAAVDIYVRNQTTQSCDKNYSAE